MNETFDIEDCNDAELQSEQVLLMSDLKVELSKTQSAEISSPVISIVPTKTISTSKNSLTQAHKKLFDFEEQKRRESILLIENNFELMQKRQCTLSGESKETNGDDFLENELIPDDLLDEMHTFIENVNATISLSSQHIPDCIKKHRKHSTDPILLDLEIENKFNSIDPRDKNLLNSSDKNSKILETSIITVNKLEGSDLKYQTFNESVKHEISADTKLELASLADKLKTSVVFDAVPNEKSINENPSNGESKKTSVYGQVKIVIDNLVENVCQENKNTSNLNSAFKQVQKVNEIISQEISKMPVKIKTNDSLELNDNKTNLNKHLQTADKNKNENENSSSSKPYSNEFAIENKTIDESENILNKLDEIELVIEQNQLDEDNLQDHCSGNVGDCTIFSEFSEMSFKSKATTNTSIISQNDANKKTISEKSKQSPKSLTTSNVKQQVKPIAVSPTVTRVKKTVTNDNKPTIQQNTRIALNESKIESKKTLTESNTGINPTLKSRQKTIQKTTIKSNKTGLNENTKQIVAEYCLSEVDSHTSGSCISDNDESKTSTKSSSKSESTKTGQIQPQPVPRKRTTVQSTSSTTSTNPAQRLSTASISSTGSNQPLNKNIIETPTNTLPSTPAPTQNVTSRLNKTPYNSTTSKTKHNKENQQIAIPKSLALNKIYKSRDGLTAVSSNTSIMSELSNISKSSLPSSIPTSTAMRHPSISSTTSSIRPNSATTTKNTSLIIQRPISNSSTVSESIKATHQAQSITTRLGSNSGKQTTQSSATSLSRLGVDTNYSNMPHESPTTVLPSSRRLIGQTEVKTGLKKATQSNRNEIQQTTGLLQVTTALNGAQTVSSSSSPASSVSTKNKTEVKLNKEIKRLEALCESRTKELTMLKLKLRDTLVSFDAIAVAFNYLSNDLKGFEVNELRAKLNSSKLKHQLQVKTLQLEIEEKETCLKSSLAQLDRLTIESNEAKLRLEKELEQLKTEHQIQLNYIKMENDLIIKEVKREKDLAVKNLNKQIETLKIENDKNSNELKEQLFKKQNETLELETRIKECEETLAKDKDERIQRLMDTQRNLEKEIESMKAAIDIKNSDLFELRTKNNELITKIDNYNDLNMKLRRYKQELEEVNAILKNKQEAEYRTAEYNKQLAMKIEVKNRENQRLSMQNEQLQFRLQSQPNLCSLNQDSSFNSPSLNDNSQSFSKNNEKSNLSSTSQSRLKRASTITESSSGNGIVKGVVEDESFAVDDISQDATSTTPVVKLRSKSFKTNSKSNQQQYSIKKYTNLDQIRPVSEFYDVNTNERDMFMTRSAIMYEESVNSMIIGTIGECGTSGGSGSGINGERCASSSSSNSHLEINTNQENQMTKSVPCMVLSNDDNFKIKNKKANEQLNTKSNYFLKNDNSCSSSSLSINDNSIIILD